MIPESGEMRQRKKKINKKWNSEWLPLRQWGPNSSGILWKIEKCQEASRRGQEAGSWVTSSHPALFNGCSWGIPSPAPPDHKIPSGVRLEKALVWPVCKWFPGLAQRIWWSSPPPPHPTWHPARGLNLGLPSIYGKRGWGWVGNGETR